MGVEVAAGWFKTGAGAGEDTAAMAFTPTGWGAFASSAPKKSVKGAGADCVGNTGAGWVNC